MPVFRTRRRVEFRDTDAAGIMHFSTFFLRMEESEHELLRALGLSVWMPHGETEGKLTWPRVSAQCDYRSAARFEDELEIEVRVERLGDKSVTYGFRFMLGERLVAEGRTTAVCCILHSGQLPTSISIPTMIREKLSEFTVPA